MCNDFNKTLLPFQSLCLDDLLIFKIILKLKKVAICTYTALTIVNHTLQVLVIHRLFSKGLLIGKGQNKSPSTQLMINMSNYLSPELLY